MLTPAARARTIAATATELRVGVLDRAESVLRHAVDTDGTLLFLAPAGSPLAAAGLVPQGPSVTATLQDVGAVPTADRIRGSVTLSGRPGPVARRLPAQLVSYLCGEETTPGRPVLELRPTAISLAWHVEGASGATAVPLAAYADARPDPLAGWEAGFLRHLDDEHASLLPGLARLAGLEVPPGRVRPVLADAHGLVLRATGAGGPDRDVRLAFPTPATCGCDAVAAFNLLLEQQERGVRAD